MAARRKVAGGPSICYCWGDGADTYVDSWGLTPRARLLFDAIREVALSLGQEEPRILSGFRTPDLQLAMQEAWDRGDREGLAVRPANPGNSAHCRGAAFDLANPLDLVTRWGTWVAASLTPKCSQIQWGGMWITPDPRHFEWR